MASVYKTAATLAPCVVLLYVIHSDYPQGYTGWQLYAGKTSVPGLYAGEAGTPPRFILRFAKDHRAASRCASGARSRDFAKPDTRRVESLTNTSSEPVRGTRREPIRTGVLEGVIQKGPLGGCGRLRSNRPQEACHSENRRRDE